MVAVSQLVITKEMLERLRPWIKEGEYALHWTGLSCHRFVANQVRLALFVLAYNRATSCGV